MEKIPGKYWAFHLFFLMNFIALISPGCLTELEDKQVQLAHQNMLQFRLQENYLVARVFKQPGGRLLIQQEGQLS